MLVRIDYRDQNLKNKSVATVIPFEMSKVVTDLSDMSPLKEVLQNLNKKIKIKDVMLIAEVIL